MNNLIEVLEHNPNIEIIHKELILSNQAEIDTYRNTIVHDMGLDWGERIEQIVNMPKKIHIYWQTKDEFAFRASGEICMLNPIDAMIVNSFEFPNAVTQPDEIDKCILDDHPFSGDDCLTLFCINEDFTDINVYYKYQDQVYLMSTTLSDYCDILSTSFGYTHWQLFFCLPQNIIIEKFGKEFFISTLDKMKKIFERHDFTILNKKINEL